MRPEEPVCRRVRAYAFDPGMTAQTGTALINEVVLSIPCPPCLLGSTRLPSTGHNHGSSAL